MIHLKKHEYSRIELCLSHLYPIWFFAAVRFSKTGGFFLAFLVGSFVEGTRYTEEKLLAAQRYAASRGLPVPRNVLIPRTKVNLV